MRGVLIFFVEIAARNICIERTCKICDNILHGEKIGGVSAKKTVKLQTFCTAVFKIKHCCTPFLTSQNLLGPVKQEEIFEPAIKPAIALNQLSKHGIGIFLLAIGSCSGIIIYYWFHQQACVPGGSSGNFPGGSG